MKKLIKKWLTNYCIKNYPLQLTTRVIEIKIFTVLVKKGKIKEWRSYDENHNRINLKK